MLVLTSLVPVAACLALMIVIICYGIFSPIKVEIGFQYYGERADSAIGPYKLPEWMNLEMPLNALVNAGYIIVGLAWIVRTYLDERKERVGALHAYFAYTFGWMGILYGPVQFVRIVSQTHESAVLDQWVTLPFFTWAILWCKSLTTGWNPRVALMFVMSSILSYNLVFFTEFGFEIALVLHAVNAANAGYSTHVKFPCKGNNQTIFMCCLTFSIFIVFKLLDLHLPYYSNFFSEVSGHFLSKLFGDITQMHFTFLFFENIARSLQAKPAEKPKKKKKK